MGINTIISEKESSLHLHKIVVKKNSRGKGIGRMLLQNLEEIGEKSVTLKVGIENVDAKKFYASLNYIKICEVNGYETFRK
jgi:ribosomal protein S18 acetylase RimI-like enzyme